MPRSSGSSTRRAVSATRRISEWQFYSIVAVWTWLLKPLKCRKSHFFYDSGGTGTVCGSAGAAATTGVAGLVSGTHDETNYAPTSARPRGNATTVTKQCFQGSQGCTNSVTTYTYDETGQALTSKDPCGNATCRDMTGTTHSTTYSYADSYSSG